MGGDWEGWGRERQQSTKGGMTVDSVINIVSMTVNQWQFKRKGAVGYGELVGEEGENYLS